MALHLMLQCAWQLTTALPRDKVMITPCFRIDDTTLQDADALCEDLADALDTWDGNTGQLEVKSYDLEGTPPVRPNGTAVRNAAAVGTINSPRELACCLSFYGGPNAPSNRGRLYIPNLFGYDTNSLRPSQTFINKVAELPGIFAGLGGSNVDWIVWSRTKRAATGVEHWWINDEWDIQRRRGLRETARTTGNTSG